MITPPKTPKSNRVIKIPDFLAEEIEEYINALYGITDKDIASYKMEPGYKLTAYVNADLTGVQKEYTDAEMVRLGTMSNRASSFLIEKVDEESGINELQNTTNKATACYDLQGRLLNGRPEKGLYVTRQGKYLIK